MWSQVWPANRKDLSKCPQVCRGVVCLYENQVSWLNCALSWLQLEASNWIPSTCCSTNSFLALWKEIKISSHSLQVYGHLPNDSRNSLTYKSVPNRGGQELSQLLPNMEITVFCTFSPAFAKKEINFKGMTWNNLKEIFLDIFKTRNYKFGWGGEGKLILHILEALQTAPRKGANTFQAGSCICSHDSPKHKTYFSVYKQQPVG